MRRMCAWCGTELGLKEPFDNSDVISTICSGCAEHLVKYRRPVLVVSREWVRLYEELVEIFKNRPEIQVILDRRDPTGGRDGASQRTGPERRKSRQAFSLE